MRNKLLILAVFVVIAFCVPIVLLKNTSAAAVNSSKQITMNLAREYAEELSGKMDDYIEALQSLSSEMNFYENLTPETRRREYEKMMQSVFEEIPEFVQMFTVWKPNAIDNMDARFIGRPGATPTGQFAFALTNENGQVEKQTSGDVQAAMAYLTGPNNKTVEIADLAFINLAEREKLCFRIMVPIINDRTNESVGVIGCYIDVDTIQILAEQAIKYNDEICSIAVYTNTGFILANYLPDRIGKKLVDVEIQYGDYVDMAAEAVKKAQEYECKSYDPVLRTNMYMSIAPVSLAASPIKWSIMIGSIEDYMMKDVRATSKLIIALMVIAGIGVIIVFVIIINRKKKKNNH